jgi:hypothetical protein
VTRNRSPIRPHAQACAVVFRARFVALRAVQPSQVSRGFKGFWLGIAGGTFTLSIVPSAYRILRKRYNDFCCMSYFRVPISTLCQPFRFHRGSKSAHRWLERRSRPLCLLFFSSNQLERMKESSFVACRSPGIDNDSMLFRFRIGVDSSSLL